MTIDFFHFFFEVLHGLEVLLSFLGLLSPILEPFWFQLLSNDTHGLTCSKENRPSLFQCEATVDHKSLGRRLAKKKNS